MPRTGTTTIGALVVAGVLAVGGCDDAGTPPPAAAPSPSTATAAASTASAGPVDVCTVSVFSAAGVDATVRVDWGPGAVPSAWQPDASVDIVSQGRQAGSPLSVPVGHSRNLPPLAGGFYSVFVEILPASGVGPSAECDTFFTVI
ncbi:hypothetical protein [Frankia sp. AgW1.1]|nr:hypothetical protein [Frankia sp. AgW1.1]MBL7493270.1 hypothetical protein [Frankia sp. AgW1.1]